MTSTDGGTHEVAATWKITVSNDGFLAKFSDEAAWASARSYWWTILDAEFLRVRPSDQDSDAALHGPWQGALDLLAFGKGWVHIAVELEYWRETGYPKTDPILRFIADNFGDSIAYLELYLKLFPGAEARIRRYLYAPRPELGDEKFHVPRANNINDLTFTLREHLRHDRDSFAWPHVRAFMPWIVDEPERDFTNSEIEDGLPGMGWDEGHVFAHFAHDWWGEPVYEFESGDTIEIVSQSRWRVEFDRYTDWYLKVNHVLTNDEELSNLGADRPKFVDVFVNGVGFLGTFVHDLRTGRVIRQVPERFGDSELASETSSALLTYSPRFGFPITEKMARALVAAEPHEIHTHAEEIEMLGRDDNDWIYSLGWGVHDTNGTKYWSRDGGAWSEYYPIVEGIKFTTFLQEAIAKEQLDLELPLYEAVMDGSTCHEIQPWAASLLLAEWDKPTPFPRLYAELGSMWEGQTVSREDLGEDVWRLLTARMHEIFPRPKPQGQTEDELDLFMLVFNGVGSMTVREALHVVITGERE